MNKAIVTGANGFVGSALCRTLVENNVDVIAVIKSKSSDISTIDSLPGIQIIYCDMRDFGKLDEYIKDENVDIFYHFAWNGTAGDLRGDYQTQLNNIKYTLDVIGACNRIGCKRLVFAGSLMGFEVQAAMREERPIGITSIYSAAKMSADYMARIYAENLGISYMRCVISNIYGPGEKSPRLVNSSIRKLMKGEHCSFSDGEQLYDFIYIDDAADAIIKIGEAGTSSKTYYIGSTEVKPLKEYLIEMRDCINPELEIGLGEIPFQGVSLTYNEFDRYALQNDLGFYTKVSFREGIRKTMEWIKETGNE